jgi:hypothetical protein
MYRRGCGGGVVLVAEDVGSTRRCRRHAHVSIGCRRVDAAAAVAVVAVVVVVVIVAIDMRCVQWRQLPHDVV